MSINEDKNSLHEWCLRRDELVEIVEALDEKFRLLQQQELEVGGELKGPVWRAREKVFETEYGLKQKRTELLKLRTSIKRHIPNIKTTKVNIWTLLTKLQEVSDTLEEVSEAYEKFHDLFDWVEARYRQFDSDNATNRKRLAPAGKGL